MIDGMSRKFERNRSAIVQIVRRDAQVFEGLSFVLFVVVPCSVPARPFRFCST